MSKPAERVLVFGHDMRIFLAVVRSRGRAGKEMQAAASNWHSPTLQSKYACAVYHLPRYSTIRAVGAQSERAANPQKRPTWHNKQT